MNYCNKIAILIMLSSSSILLLVGEAQATIFKCVNSKGTTYYNDKPCPKADDETKFNAVKDPTNGYVPPVFVDKEQKTKTNGVVVGGGKTTGQQKLSDRNKSKSEEKFGSQSSGGNFATNQITRDSSEENQNFNYQDNSNSISGNTGTTTRRNQKQLASRDTQPSAPLKVEENTKEPRTRVYE